MTTLLHLPQKKKKVPKSTQKSFFFERHFCSLLRFLFFLQLFHLGWIALPFASANFLLYFSVSYALNVNCQVSLGWLENSRDKLIKCAFTCATHPTGETHVQSSRERRMQCSSHVKGKYLIILLLSFLTFVKWSFMSFLTHWNPPPQKKKKKKKPNSIMS